jgi:hypothetical protein
LGAEAEGYATIPAGSRKTGPITRVGYAGPAIG